MSTQLCVAAYRWGDRTSREAAAEVLRALSPDVVVVHHVPGHPLAGHRIAAFADRLDLVWSGGPHRRSGATTILTALRVDVLDERHLPLGPRGRGGYAVTRLRLPGHRPCLVVGTHVSRADGAAEVTRLREELALRVRGGAPLAALSANLEADLLARAWPGRTGVVVPVGERVSSAVVDPDRLGAG